MTLSKKRIDSHFVMINNEVTFTPVKDNSLVLRVGTERLSMVDKKCV